MRRRNRRRFPLIRYAMQTPKIGRGMESSLKHPKYRPDIDGLRAIAVLSVVAYHVVPEICTGGFVGVDIFFVISGYLISNIIIGSLANGRFSYALFYARRIRRIFPALIVVLASCLAIGWLDLFADEFKLLGKHVFLGATFIANLGLWREAGYFDQQAHVKVLLHLWSLGIEEQFYILWPLLLALAFRLRANLLALILVVTGASFLTNAWLVTNHAEATFYLPTSRLWELSMGAALAYIHWSRTSQLGATEGNDASVAQSMIIERLQRRSAISPTILSLVGFGLILISIFGLNKTLTFPGWWALLPSMGALLMIASGPSAVVNRYLLAMPVVVWFGLISYPLYLWHWPILTFVKILNNELPTLTIRLMVILVSVLLAWLTYRLVEHPLRFQLKSRLLPIYLSVVLGVIALIGLAIFLGQGVPNRSAANVVTPGIDLTSTALQDPHSLPQATNCLSEFRPDDVDRCATNSAAPEVLVLGDSHAGHLYTGLMATALPVAVIWNGGCPPTLDLHLANNCAYRWHVLLDYVKTHKASVRLVALSTDYALYTQINSLNGNMNHEHQAIVREAKSEGRGGNVDKILLEDTEAVLLALESQGVRAVLIRDIPALPYEARACLRRRFVPFPKIEVCMPVQREVVERYHARENEIEAQLQRWRPGVSMFDPMPVFCDVHYCQAVFRGKLLYRDDNHLNDAGSRLLAIPLSEWLGIHSIT
jgi:peptidoglycan/LPS O-acetylase OafA/YrhL